MERFVVQPMASSKGYFGMMCQLHLIAAIYNDGTSGVWEMAVLMHSDYDSAFLKLFFFFLSVEACSDAYQFCPWACLCQRKGHVHALSSILACNVDNVSVCCILFQDGIYLLSEVQGIGSFDAFQLLYIYGMVFKFPQSLHWKAGSGTCSLSVGRRILTSAKTVSAPTVSQIIACTAVGIRMCDACGH